MGCGAEAPSEPAHWPRHRGSGARFPLGDWHPLYWIPLCRKCHDLVDWRTGTSSRVSALRKPVVELINERQPRWKERWAA